MLVNYLGVAGALRCFAKRQDRHGLVVGRRLMDVAVDRVRAKGSLAVRMLRA